MNIWYALDTALLKPESNRLLAKYQDMLIKRLRKRRVGKAST